MKSQFGIGPRIEGFRTGERVRVGRRHGYITAISSDETGFWFHVDFGGRNKRPKIRKFRSKDLSLAPVQS